MSVAGNQNIIANGESVQRVSTLWRNTGGRINDRIFRYPIGGEK